MLVVSSAADEDGKIQHTSSLIRRARPLNYLIVSPMVLDSYVYSNL
jgi:hypothetical protein